MSQVEIKVTVAGKEMTMDEARKIYRELHKLFGRDDTPVIPRLPKPDRWDRIPSPYPDMPKIWCYSNMTTCEN